jgi:hypothetical protein
LAGFLPRIDISISFRPAAALRDFLASFDALAGAARRRPVQRLPCSRFMKCPCGEIFDMRGPEEVVRHVQHISQAEAPPKGWGWCYVDEVMFDLSGRPTPHLGPIPRFY